jgi:hypothetical protein
MGEIDATKCHGRELGLGAGACSNFYVTGSNRRVLLSGPRKMNSWGGAVMTKWKIFNLSGFSSEIQLAEG